MVSPYMEKNTAWIMAKRPIRERSVHRLTHDLRTVAFYCHRSFEYDFLREKVADFPLVLRTEES